ncbi:hypothetical protein GCM10010441_54190 [Kitasatospora paracochleata]|uniref:bpX6 domain-containing protein n=1 Tax=Kitasatospora paracochleata TaxID=58354 RepID=UPI0031E2F665
MSVTATGPARGLLAASGFVLDVPAIGAAEAAERVLALWADGAELRELPHGAWLLRLPKPVQVYADRAPGEPLAERSGALVTHRADPAAPAPDDEGRLLLPRGGAVERHRVAELPLLRPAEWLDRASIPLRRLAPLDLPPEPDPVDEALPARPQPDLRAAARLAPRSERARRQLADDPGPDRTRALRPLRALDPRTRRMLGSTAVLLPLLALCLLLPENVVPHRLLLALLAGVAIAPVAELLIRGGRPSSPRGAAARRAAGPAPAAAKAGGARRHPPSALLARLLMRTPAARLVQSRHDRYLDELTRAFRQRRWEDALRDAVAVSAGGAAALGWLTLALPGRRTGPLRPSPAPNAPGGVMPGRATVRDHLAALYREAAAALEREGRIEEAAFTLADLLGAAAEAVIVLERHGRLALAAELAEGRNLTPDLVVRLWWLAGDRDRAVRVARERGAFAAAVERLGRTDPQAAGELRAAWVRSCRQSGDHLGAVRAAWPEESLRPTVVGDLRRLVALGGPTQAVALAHLLALGAGEAVRDHARALLDTTGPEHRTHRRRLAATLGELRCADPVADRELATAALRALVRDGGLGEELSSTERGRLRWSLLDRADPLAAADLPAPDPGGADEVADATEAAVPVVTAPTLPGDLPLHDAAALASGAVLVACGHAGTRLLAPDGRTTARWDVPAERIVLNDHGTTALLAARYGATWEVVRLDLATREVARWAAVRADHLAGSYDGRTLLTVDGPRLVVLDTLAARPAVIRYELGDESRPAGPPARTADGCSALVHSNGRTERWRWDLPGWDLRSRHRLTGADEADAVLADGLIVQVPAEQAPAEPARGTARVRLYGERADDGITLPLAPGTAVPADGDRFALAVPQADGSVRAAVCAGTERLFTAVFPQARPEAVRLRRHTGTVTVWDAAGRVLAVADDGSVLARLRTSAI